MSEEKELDTDSLKNNHNLEKLIELKIKYKIPLIILLTHSDLFCEKIKKEKRDNWRSIYKEKINANKNNLLNNANDLIKKIDKESNYTINEKDIIHTVLVEPKHLTDEEAIQKLPPKRREKYDKADEKKKKEILEEYLEDYESINNETINFIKEDKEIKELVFDKKKLSEEIKKKLPFQYHNALNN